MSEPIQVKTTIVIQYEAQTAPEAIARLEEISTMLKEAGYHKDDENSTFQLFANGRHITPEEIAARMLPEEQDCRILDGEVPMSVKEAKNLLFPHIEDPNYLTKALVELAAMTQWGKTVRKTARGYIIAAANELEKEKRDRQ